MYLPLSRPPLGLPFELNRTSPQARGLRVLIPVHTQQPGGFVDELVSGARGVPGTGVSWLAGATPPVRYIDMAGAAAGVVTFASIPHLSLATGACTFAGWVRPDVVSAVGGQVVFGDGNAAGSGGAMSLIFASTAGAARVYWGSGYRSTSDAVFSAGTWYHVALVRSGSAGAWAVQWYVNGAPAGTTTGIAANPDAPTAFSLGRFGAYTGGLFFDGGMSDLRFYNRALSAAEVLAMWAPQTWWELYRVRAPGRKVPLPPITLSAAAAHLLINAPSAAAIPGAISLAAAAAHLVLTAPGSTVVPGVVTLLPDAATLLFRSADPTLLPGAVVIPAAVAHMVLDVPVALATVGPVRACLTLSDALLATLTLSDAPLTVLTLTDEVCQ